MITKYAVGGSFRIPVFLKSVPEDPEEWLTSDSLVGVRHAFVNRYNCVPGSCSNCLTQQDTIIEGFVHLNEALAERSGLGTLEPEVVEPYPTRELHWRAVKSSGEAIELSELPSLGVTAIATRLGLPPGSMFPVPEERIHRHGITEGKPAGARSSDVEA
ncbi:hypothetical protein PM082_020871 [Marasmius tenuissimus]|nr:hypothetical protein PM082_020871 [Marasmius tenuissimus]